MSDGPCARCGNTADVDVMDFGPFIGEMTCADCWVAECEAVYAAIEALECRE